MTTSHQLQAVNGSQIIPVTDGEIRSYAVMLSFGVAPSAGTVTVETQAIGSADWVPVTRGEDVGITSGQASFSFDGAIRFVRVTFSGLVGGVMPILWVSSQSAMIPIFDLLTDGGNGPARRLRVDPGQTGFFARRMWALAYEFASANPIAGTPLVFRLVIPVNFIVHAHSLSVDQGGITLRTYSASQGTPGGVFGTTHTVVSENGMDEQSLYAFQAAVTSGGTFTPTMGAVPITPLRVRPAGATAQQSSVGGSAVSEKGRPANTYYAVLARMTGVNGDCTGVYNLVIEERP
jgi:hypothetical protein